MKNSLVSDRFITFAPILYCMTEVKAGRGQ